MELEHAIAGRDGIDHMIVRGEHGIGIARQNIEGLVVGDNVEMDHMELGLPVPFRKTSYAVYLVFKLTDNPCELERATASLRFVNEGAEGAGIEGTTVFISKKKELPGELGRFPHLRSDGWLEIKLGEFFNNLGEDGEVEMRLMEINDKTWKSGIIVKGFDIRPN
ncbi:F-box protein PP2-B11-like [Nicotiana tomentosiformis]|uniref:F-box protein PP2-B11-like n=1 Tax=Nicotiana tomentosiformis TaxID=4098 RepID=UPI00388C4B6B